MVISLFQDDLYKRKHTIVGDLFDRTAIPKRRSAHAECK